MSSKPRESDSVARARLELGLAGSVKAQVWRVRRLDRPNADYDLIVFGEKNAAVAVATVTVSDGQVASSARLAGLQPQLNVSAEEAIALARMEGNARAVLVWQPSSISQSPLYPIWEVQDATTTRYVDQQGKVWQQLIPPGRGGQSPNPHG